MNHSHGPDEYLRLQIVRQGFYLPGALPRLAKYRRKCVFCKRRADVRSINKKGHVGSRLTETTFMKNCVGDNYIGGTDNKNNTLGTIFTTEGCKTFLFYISLLH